MKEQTKKKFAQKIVDWMKGVDSDMPTIPSGGSEKPRMLPNRNNVYQPEVRENQMPAGQIGGKGYNKPPQVFSPAGDNTPSAGMGRRLKQESDDFYNSDAGKGADPFDMSKAMDAFKNQGMGKIYNKPKGSEFNKSVTERDPKDYFTKKDPYSELNSGSMDKTKLGIMNKGGLTEMEKGIITGSSATAAGAATGAAANSYWSRKKEQDRNGNK